MKDTAGKLYISYDFSQAATFAVCRSIGHQPNAEQAGVGHSVAVARFYHKADAQEYIRAANEYAALNAVANCFDKWYCESGHLCGLTDAIKNNPTEAQKDELVRLQNLLVASINLNALRKQ